jgi:hypothetical protein
MHCGYVKENIVQMLKKYSRHFTILFLVSLESWIFKITKYLSRFLWTGKEERKCHKSMV